MILFLNVITALVNVVRADGRGDDHEALQPNGDQLYMPRLLLKLH